MTRTRILASVPALALVALGGLTACNPNETLTTIEHIYNDHRTPQGNTPADSPPEMTYVTYPNSEPLADGSIITDPGNGGPPIIIRPPGSPSPVIVTEDNVPWPCGVTNPGNGGPPIVRPCPTDR